MNICFPDLLPHDTYINKLQANQTFNRVSFVFILITNNISKAFVFIV